MFDPREHLIQLPRRVKDRQTGEYTTVYDDYLEVKWRLVWFREKFPHGVIETEEVCVDLERGYARYRAVVDDGEGGTATGYGTETAAGFADYVECAETRALGRALAALGIGTQFVGQDLSEGEHIVDAPVVRAAPADGHGTGASAPPPEAEVTPGARITQDEARELKKAAQQAYGYREGERRLRADLGFEVDEALTLRHLAAHVRVEQYARLRAAYGATLRQEVAADG
jgi:hypothetical protein